MAKQNNISQTARSGSRRSIQPHPALHALFTYYSLPDIRHQLWELLKAALTGAEHQQPAERSGMLLFYEMLSKALEDAYGSHNGKGANRKASKRSRKSKHRGTGRFLFEFSAN